MLISRRVKRHWYNANTARKNCHDDSSHTGGLGTYPGRLESVKCAAEWSAGNTLSECIIDDRDTRETIQLQQCATYSLCYNFVSNVATGKLLNALKRHIRKKLYLPIEGYMNQIHSALNGHNANRRNL